GYPAAPSSSCRGLTELGFDDLAVLRASGHQLVVRSDPDDTALIKDHDPIRVQDRAHALRDDDDVRIARLGAERPAPTRIGRCVKRGETVVEEIDRRPPHERAPDPKSPAPSTGY